MDTEQCHIECYRNNDQTKDSGKEVLEPQSLFRAFSVFSKSQAQVVAETYGCNGLGVANQNPQLDNGQAPNPSDCEQAYPFHAHGGAKPKAGCNKPKPPNRIEGFGRALLMLICEAGPGQSSKCGENN